MDCFLQDFCFLRLLAKRTLQFPDLLYLCGQLRGRHHGLPNFHRRQAAVLVMLAPRKYLLWVHPVSPGKR
ncbi:cell shape-determining protein MreD [Paraburkholderia caledonica]|uniref:Cell shape-determining protein MreD n=1 Tax=Paraburkholderia caledonica TaxID=134536 RepID=A0AB73IPB5_9BURK|nr:cell shape-determining protein MreD [Paraburkholderia caledonica]